MGFLIRFLITAVGIWLAARLVPGIVVDDTPTLLWAALWLGIVNAVVRPVAVFLTLPITLLSLGLFLWVINAGMLGLVAWLLEGMRIAGFGSALLGALIVGLTGWIGNGFIGEQGRYEVVVMRREERS
ncbi:MAG: phage holin family protein [Spirochaetaceae bacterium]|nr:phage holin family protein [Myxococcales bacterium]MCB9722589.1 phage holin family protein [Spirochaetaceae bacterium]